VSPKLALHAEHEELGTDRQQCMQHAVARAPPCPCPACSSSTRLGVPKRTAELAAQLDARVAEWGGDKPIHSVLVANNGLAATKFMRSVRSWAYKNFGNERAGEAGDTGRCACAVYVCVLAGREGGGVGGRGATLRCGLLVCR
jgi:hypothetical protein